MDLRTLSNHFTNILMTAAYGSAGTIGGLSASTQWAHGKVTVKQVIAASVLNSIFNQIKGSMRTMDVWDTLKALFEGRMQTIVVDLHRQIQSMKCREDNNVRTHFNNITNLHEQLATMGKSIPNDKYVSILLSSIPSNYKATISAMSTTAALHECGTHTRYSHMTDYQ